MKQVRIIDMVLGGANQESCSLLLYDDESCRVLPIIIMKEEAQAMLSAMKNINYPRPMTFNLMAQIIRSNHVHPQGAYITDISEGIFMAHLKMKQGKSIKEYDARPSDAITIALLFDCPILVSHKVLDTAGLPVPDQYKNSLPREKGMDYLAQLVEASLADMKTKIAASKIKTPVATIEKQINNLMKYIFEEA
jgi:bifunctional DNase/RNase